MPSKEEAKPEPMEVKANKMEAVSVTSAGAVSPAAAASSASAEKVRLTPCQVSAEGTSQANQCCWV